MLTTAGVTREATASVAWSSASRGSMLALLMGAMVLSGAVAAFDVLVADDECSSEQDEAESQQRAQRSALALALNKLVSLYMSFPLSG